jgi:hypothetical protein
LSSSHSEKVCLSRPNELPKNDVRLAIAISSSRYIRFIEAARMDGTRGSRKTQKTTVRPRCCLLAHRIAGTKLAEVKGSDGVISRFVCVGRSPDDLRRRS